MRNASFMVNGLKTLVAVALLSLSAQLAFAADLEIKSEAFKEVTKVGADGVKHVEREALTRAVPGTEVIYVLTYHNKGDKPATDVKIDNPIPKPLVYKVDSAAGDNTTISFSVDGGHSFGKLESLKVTGADGKPRAVRAEDVNVIRWTMNGAIKPGASGSVTYRATLP